MRECEWKGKIEEKVRTNVLFWRGGFFLQKTIWKDETSEYRLEPLTKEAVACAERLFQVKLPHSYLRILQEQNGGNFVYNAFPALRKLHFYQTLKI